MRAWASHSSKPTLNMPDPRRRECMASTPSSRSSRSRQRSGANSSSKSVCCTSLRRSLNITAHSLRQTPDKPPEKQQHAAMGSRRRHPRPVARHQVHQLQRVIAGLAQQVRLHDTATIGVQLNRIAGGAGQGAGPPILDLQQQQAPARRQHHKVELVRSRANGQVMPHDVVALQARRAFATTSGRLLA